MSEHAFKVNLGGLIHLLSDHLYEQPMSFLRELMQNSVDAITARQFQDDNEQAPTITCELIRSGDESVLAFEDNGCGLSEADLHTYLSTIASSSKRGALADGGAFIGKFGIGFLACFIVADSITVFSKHAEHPGVAWTGMIDGSYRTEASTFRTTPGTTVHLNIKASQRDLFHGDTIISWLKRYGALLPFSVVYREGDNETRINTEPPWLQQFAEPDGERNAHLQFAAEMLQENPQQFLTAIPLVDPEGVFEATAVIMRQTVSINVRQQHAVYLKRMYLNTIDGIAPDWAFFVRLVVNVNQAAPLASREGLRKDEQFERLQHQVEESLKSWLLHVVRHQPELAEIIVGLHGNALRRLAADDDDACQLLGPLIKVETSRGTVQLRQVIEEQGSLPFIDNVDEFRQLRPLLASGETSVINAGYADIEAVLWRLGAMGNIPVNRLNGEALSAELSSAPDSDHEQCSMLERHAEQALAEFDVATEVKAFDPAQLPALIHINESAWNHRHTADALEDAGPFAGMLGNFQSPTSVRARLILNWNNGLIRKLSHLAVHQVTIPVRMLYVQAMLQGHHPLNGQEQGIIGHGIETIIAQAEQGGAA